MNYVEGIWDRTFPPQTAYKSVAVIKDSTMVTFAPRTNQYWVIRLKVLGEKGPQDLW